MGLRYSTLMPSSFWKKEQGQIQEEENANPNPPAYSPTAPDIEDKRKKEEEEEEIVMQIDADIQFQPPAYVESPLNVRTNHQHNKATKQKDNECHIDVHVINDVNVCMLYVYKREVGHTLTFFEFVEVKNRVVGLDSESNINCSNPNDVAIDPGTVFRLVLLNNIAKTMIFMDDFFNVCYILSEHHVLQGPYPKKKPNKDFMSLFSKDISKMFVWNKKTAMLEFDVQQLSKAFEKDMTKKNSLIMNKSPGRTVYFQ